MTIFWSFHQSLFLVSSASLCPFSIASAHGELSQCLYVCPCELCIVLLFLWWLYYSFLWLYADLVPRHLLTFPFSDLQKNAKQTKAKKVVLHYIIDCDIPVQDGIMDAASFVRDAALYFCSRLSSALRLALCPLFTRWPVEK